jgi:hypothetical protein
METKQSITPGPWSNDETYSTSLGRTSTEVSNENSDVVAVVFGDTREQVAADANAIAALPEIIAALQGLTDYYAARWGVDAGAEKVWYAAKGALAKAGAYKYPKELWAGRSGSGHDL